MKNQNIKEMYNHLVDGETYEKDFEFNRWCIRARNRAEYTMLYRSISNALKGTSFATCLEVGPGPGTWTRLVHRTNPQAKLDLVDISEAMREQFFLEMRGGDYVNYQVMDIMAFVPKQPYDLFFSSRVVEYFDDKPGFFAKLPSFIAAGGKGVIVTKNPYHGVRKSPEPQHQGQISMPDMKGYLSRNGFKDIKFFPAVRRIPIVSRFASEPAEYLLQKNLNTELDVNKN